MQENCLLVQQGFRILVSSLSGYIGQQLNRVYGANWWNEVLSALSDQYDLPAIGDYGELIDSLDIANCIRLIDRKWNEVFRSLLPLNCRTWARELMGIRNEIAHIGQQDFPQPQTECTAREHSRQPTVSACAFPKAYATIKPLHSTESRGRHAHQTGTGYFSGIS